MKNYKINKAVLPWLLISISIIVTINAYPQITIDNNDMPSPGDTVRRSTALNIDEYDFELTGEDYLWDFSELISITQTVDTFVRVTETPLFYWPFFLLSANLASPVLTDSPIPELPLSNVYTFYNNNASNYKDVGFAATLFQIPLPFNYDDPDVLYEFPMDYGNVDSSESGFEFALEGLGYIAVNKKRINTVDGWGTLITPYGSFDVLRLKSEVTEYDSIYIDSISVGLPIELEYVEYKWMGKNQKLPLLQATNDLLSLIVTYIDSVPISPTDTPEFLNAPLVFTCYPNPTREVLKIDYDFSIHELLKLKIYSTIGELVYQKDLHPTNAGNSELNMNELGIPEGAYIVELSSVNYRGLKKIFYIK